MLKFVRSHKIIMGLSLLVATLLGAVVVSTVAWFTESRNFAPVRFDTGVTEDYFDSKITNYPNSGDTTYVITRPEHYKNMVNLYGSNFDGGFDEHTYFQLGKQGLDTSKATEYKFYYYDSDGKIHNGEYTNYLNMNYYSGGRALAPLGSEEHPFVSHIIGNNLTVTNIHITGKGTSDIGIFGYVHTGATIQNVYYDGVDIDTGGSTTDVASNSNHTAHAANINVGFLAGHVKNETQFTNAYVNHTQIRNSATNVYLDNNNYGFFGYCDEVTTSQTGGESFHYSLNPNSTYDYFTDKYDVYKNDTLAVQDTEYSNLTITDNVADVISYDSTDDYYTFKGDKSGDTTPTYNYSLGTTGARTSDINYELYYKNGSNYIRDFPANTRQTTVAPEDANSSGTFMYYDTTNSKWIYYEAARSGETTEQNFYCYTISFMSPVSSSKKYLKYSSGSLGYDTTVPQLPEPGDTAADISSKKTNYGDYYFCLKASQSGTGVTSISDAAAGEYYIFNPKNNVYLYDTGSGASFTSDITEAQMFTVSARTNGFITYYNSSNKKRGLVSVGGTADPTMENVVVGKAEIGFTFETISNNTSSYSDPNAGKFKKVTETATLTNNSTIAFLGTDEDDSNKVYAMAGQNQNNRGKAGPITNFYTSNGTTYFKGSEVGSGFKTFRINSTTISGTTYYSFFDLDNVVANQGYLYAAGGTTKNYLRTEAALDGDGKGYWTISISSGSATITAKDSSTTRNTMAFNYGADCFAAYQSSSITDQYNMILPEIWIMYENDSALIYTSQGVQVAFVADSGGTYTSTTYDTYYSPLGGDASTRRVLAFAPAQIAGWTFRTISYVSIYPEEQTGWYLVETLPDLVIGDQYLISTVVTSGTSGYVAGGSISSYTMPAISSTYDTTQKTVVPGEGYVSLKLGGTSGAYTFQNSSDQYLADSDNGLLFTTTLDNKAKWTIEINDGTLTIKNNAWTSDWYILYNSGFESAQSGSAVSLYHYKEDSISQPLWFADEIKSGYDSDFNRNYVDLVGNAEIHQQYFKLDDGAYDNMKTMSYWNSNSAGVGYHFYQTKYASDAIVVKVPNKGSLDFGTISLTCTGADTPVFIKGNDAASPLKKAVSFSDVSCDNDGSASAQSYSLSLNPYNIYQLSYCALDTSGDILSAYDSTGAKTCPAGDVTLSSIKYFVLVISAPDGGTVNITDFDFEHTAVTGNAGDFGTVGYRSATYSSGSSASGNNISSGTVDGAVIYFSYSALPTTANVYCTMSYDPTGNGRYDLYFYSSVDCYLFVFNYDAERAALYVNGARKKDAYNVIAITAGAPTGGWNPSYTAITTH